MTSRVPPGHLTGAIASIYFLGKYLVLSYNSKKFERHTKNDAELSEASGLSLSMKHSWPHLSDENNDILVIPVEVHTHSDKHTDRTESKTSSVILECVKIEEGTGTHIVHMYPPYDQTFDHFYRRQFGAPYLEVPYGSDKAIEWLIGLLIKGDIGSFLSEGGGQLSPIPKEFWLSSHCEDVLRYNVHTQVFIDGRSAFGRVSLSRNEIDEYFSDNKSETPKFVESSEKLNQDTTSYPDRGRPDKYDQAHFFTGVTSIIFHNGYPEKFADFVQAALDRYESTKAGVQRPTISWAEDKLRPIWRDRNRSDEEGRKLN